MQLTRSNVFTRQGLSAVALAAVIALTGCATAPVSPAAEDRDANGAQPSETTQGAPSGAQQGTAQIRAGDQDFTFELALCAITSEDVLVHGPGRNDATAEPAYLSIDFFTMSSELAGELRIDLGTDQQFDSSDDILVGAIGPDYDYGLTFNAQGEGFRLYTELRHGNGGSFGPMEAVFECD